MILIAVKETDHTVTTTEGKVIHKKLASNPLKFLPSRSSDDTVEKVEEGKVHGNGKGNRAQSR